MSDINQKNNVYPFKDKRKKFILINFLRTNDCALLKSILNLFFLKEQDHIDFVHQK